MTMFSKGEMINSLWPFLKQSNFSDQEIKNMAVVLSNKKTLEACSIVQGIQCLKRESVFDKAFIERIFTMDMYKIQEEVDKRIAQTDETSSLRLYLSS